jgi:hypothetical protein
MLNLTAWQVHYPWNEEDSAFTRLALVDCVLVFVKLIFCCQLGYTVGTALAAGKQHPQGDILGYKHRQQHARAVAIWGGRVSLSNICA